VISTQLEDGVTEMGFFKVLRIQIYKSSMPDKTKAEFGPCSRMGMFCPHATASPKLLPGNKQVDKSCTIGGKRGGEVMDKIGR